MATAANGAANGGALKQPLLAAEDHEAAADMAGQQLALKPVKPVGLSWRGVTLTIPLKGKKRGRKQAKETAPTTKEILHQVAGEAPAGAATAIMGPTGSGKSSLLNALAGRVAFAKGARLEGQVYINGRPVDYALMPKLCAYVVQDDVLYGFLTVRETLMLAAHFYLPSAMPTKDKAAYVADVINALGLAKTVNTIIGDARVRGVSGGERKRVSVGVELISNPSLLFLDEPTSGLDSFQALSVMSAMRALARSGRTVVAAIHQPRSSIFDLLDQLVLVSEGRIVYAGKAEGATAHFAAQGLTCPANFCPSDYFLDIISMDYRSPELEAATRARIEALTSRWLEIQAREETHNGGAEESKQRVGGSGPQSEDAEGMIAHPEGYQSSWFTQFWRLLGRGTKQAWRNKFVLMVKVLSAVFFGLILGALYSKRFGSPPPQSAVQNYIGALFFVAVNQSFGNMQSVIQSFPLEKHIVAKERASKAYYLSAYYLSKLCSELPVTLLGPLLFSATAYYIVGLDPAPARFLVFCAIAVLDATCAVALGLAVSAFAPDVPSATALAPPIVIVCMLTGGVFINVNSLPDGAQWLPYISFIKWCFNGLAANQFRGMTFDCPDQDGKGCLTTGEQVLALYSMDEYNIGQCIAALLGITLIYTVIGYIILRLTSRRYMAMKPPAPKFPKAAQANGNGYDIV